VNWSGFIGSALTRAALLTLAAVAIGAYLIGHDASRGGARRASPMRSMIVAKVLLEYPSEWERSAGAPVGNLQLGEAAVFSPRGRASQSGLLVGELPAGEATPLPRSYLRALSAAPQVAVVSLSEAQAYRYSGMSNPSFDGSMIVYSIPKPDGSATVAACYARTGSEGFLGRCASVVAGMTQLDQAQSYDLVPVRAYASRLAALLDELDRGRRDVAATLRGGTTWAALARLGGELSASFAHGAAQLAALEAAAPASAAQAALDHALGSAASSYAALATAARAGSAAAVLRERTRVRAAETLVNEALEGFALLGYGSPAGAGSSSAA